MAGETISIEKAAATPEGEKREQSTIAFPYHDLDSSSEVARALYNRSGLGSCDLDELAAEMAQVISGTFRVKVGAARTFGLIDKDGRATVKLSDLGRAIITDDGAAAAKVEAFMAVPLYAKLYDAYKGQRIPPMKALEREMAALGVAVKQTDKARQAFERSARQAGFFNAGSDRLVRPRVDAPNGEKPQEERRDAGAEEERQRPRDKDAGGGGGGNGGGHHPLIEGLLITLPKIGESWPEADRKAWLTMAESIFAMIYQKVGDAQRPTVTNTATDQ